MKTLLITGSTGVIGSALVPLFLGEQDTAVRLVIRARSREHLRERVGRLLQFWGVEAGDPRLAGRLEVYGGDVTRSFLGLDEADYKRLAGEVTHVIHSAGNVKLNQSREAARTNAVDSTRHVLAFAEACRESGQFRKLDVVSTVGVAGRVRGLVPERPLREAREFRNTYEAAKAEAEEVVLGGTARGLPTTIHRPSMVVGDSTTGRILRFQVFYYLCELLAGKKTLGIIPDAGDMRLDIIPVDYVARAIQIASGRADAAGRIFHLCSGPSRALRLPELAHRLKEIFAGYGERLFPLRPIRSAWLRGLIPVLRRVAPGRARQALYSLTFFLAYLDEPQYFDNTETEKFFSPEDLVAPPVPEYLGKIVDYYWCQKGRTAA